MGKSALAMGMAVNVATTTNKPVLFFSLEMGRAELSQRILSSEARVDSAKLRTGRLNEEDWRRIGRAIGRLSIPLFIDDNSAVTVMEIRAKARRIAAKHGDLAMIVIDYLQLMGGNASAENRQLEVSEISRNLKILARDFKVPVVALSQLSRGIETRTDKRPTLSDLRESGALEQDADVVMFLYRPSVNDDDPQRKADANLQIAKHRAGALDDIRLVFLANYTRFDNFSSKAP
jgi:replicative DNA helicase